MKLYNGFASGVELSVFFLPDSFHFTLNKPMSSFLSATDILELQSKVSKLDGSVVIAKVEEGYYLNITYYDRKNGTDTVSTFITNDNESDNYKGTYNYETMMNVLDESVKKEEEYQLKEQKRQELLDRLTDEERELLGV
jgi:hypothetical protein